MRKGFKICQNCHPLDVILLDVFSSLLERVFSRMSLLTTLVSNFRVYEVFLCFFANWLISSMKFFGVLSTLIHFVNVLNDIFNLESNLQSND